MASKPHNVAIIGYGMSAKVFHIPLITTTPSLHLHTIHQRHPTPSNSAAADHPTVATTTSTDSIFLNPAITIVIITTPPVTHFALCKSALEHGKHVVVEKPFVPTSREADELIALAKSKELLLSVYQNRRWDTDFLTLSSLLQQNKLGRIVEFSTHFDRHRPLAPPSTSTWKAQRLPGGGAIYDLGTHLIDQVIFLFGLPERITGFVGSQRELNPEGVEDSCTVLLHYEGGMMVTVKAGVVSAEVEQLRFWVRGETGSYKKYHLDPQEPHLASGLKPGDPSFGIEPDSHAGTMTSIVDGQIKRDVCPNIKPVTYSAFYNQFADAVAGKADVPVTPEEARDVIRLIELARKSSEEGRTLKIKERYDGIDA